ncbi:MAG TPA: RsmD family RNA methyltransferase, partial [Chloroflexota bacterium]|nr:RsmD family RNA methyltransferase [Chloroflexota bacterium]
MRVIAGAAKGRPLSGPPSTRTRPTTDKVKGALFSMVETLIVAERPGGSRTARPIQIGEPDVWDGLNVLDLYAGTGALGIEALSRGAAWCDFVESDPKVRLVIARNLKATDLDRRAATIGTNAVTFVRHRKTPDLHVPYSVVLIDPPYADSSVESVMASVATGGLLVSGALVALEHSRRIDVATNYPAAPGNCETSGLTEVRRRRHGDTEVSIYRWQGPRDQETRSD